MKEARRRRGGQSLEVASSGLFLLGERKGKRESGSLLDEQTEKPGVWVEPQADSPRLQGAGSWLEWKKKDEEDKAVRRRYTRETTQQLATSLPNQLPIELVP